jgi:cytochrome c biogenesis protein CcmG/thiol:disulfide interchange protein DsbE
VSDRRRRIAPFVALGVAVVMGALFVVLAQSDTSGNDSVSSFLVGKPAPAATGSTLDGEAFDLSRRKGSWVVLNFFDPSCRPCVHEHPELVTFHSEQQALADGAELYTVINSGSDADVQAFFDDNGGGWPVVKDPTGAISVDFGVAQVPETWVIDPNGIVRQRLVGEVTATFLSSYLQQLREQGL